MNWPNSVSIYRYRLVVEAASVGMGYAGVLCWISVCFVASFKPHNLGEPYWWDVPAVRTDTSGVIAFVIAGVCLCTSEYLRLRRRRGYPARLSDSLLSSDARLIALAVSKTATVLGTGVFIYLSVNAVTHPATLEMRATHLMTWPTEGTLRAIALLLCAVSVMTWRSLTARSTPESGDVVVEVMECVDNATQG